MRSRLLLPLLALALTTSTPAAHAADPNSDEAKVRVREGQEALKAGRYHEALMKFQQACAVNPPRRCPKNLGLALLALKRYPEAATQLRKFLADPDPGDVALGNIVPGVRQAFTEAQSKCGELEIDAPSGASVSIDGKGAGLAPLGETVFVEPGAHVVSAKKDNNNELTARVDAPPGAKQTVKLQEPAAPPAPTFPVPIASQTNPQPPPTPDRVIDTRKTTWPPPTGAIVLGGVAVASAIGALILRANVSSNADTVARIRADRSCTVPGSNACNELQGAIDGGEQSSTWSNVLFATSGVAAVGAVVWWIVAPRETSAMTKSLWIAPRLGGADVGGRF